MKSRFAAAIVLLLVAFIGTAAGAEWMFVVDVEARAPDGEVLATQTFQPTECEPNGNGGCKLTWNWEGETFPTGTQEWYYPRFVLSDGAEIPVAAMPDSCDIDLLFCATGGDNPPTGPSSDCISALFRECDVQQDARGYYSNGEISGGETRSASWYEPLFVEWYEACPLPAPTPTPYPTQEPYPTQGPYPTEPVPTCMPTWTPFVEPTLTPRPTLTPLPTYTPYPPQPPF